jgi:basic membrane lipoprotein Med (substrate-binding protein (PBP1-ABC) superfamily)
VAGAAKGFSDGFLTDYYSIKDSWMEYKKEFHTIYLAEKSGEGYNIADSTAIQILDEARGTIIPVCGGAGNTMTYLCDVTLGHSYVGIDVEKYSSWCYMSILKHIDRAVGLCIGQWVSPEGMPKHQVLGLKEGYTSVTLNESSLSDYNKYITEELRQQIHEDAIRKEEEYESK